jgi:hypothetical protein
MKRAFLKGMAKGILSALLLTMVAAVPLTAFAVVGGSGENTTTYTSSTKNTYETTNQSVTERVDTYSIELKALMQGGSTIYDQTFTVAFSDPTVQAAVLSASNALTLQGAVSIEGPTLMEDLTTLANSVSVTGDPVTTNIDSIFATNVYIGPQTIMTGNDQSVPFYIVPGGIDFDTLVTSTIYQTITTTTTDTYLTTQLYELIGVPGTPTPAPVPEPATMTLLGAGLLGLAGFRKKFRK